MKKKATVAYPSTPRGEVVKEHLDNRPNAGQSRAKAAHILYRLTKRRHPCPGLVSSQF